MLDDDDDRYDSSSKVKNEDKDNNSRRVGCALMVIGLLGSWYNVEYSGWAIFVAVLLLIF